MLEMTFNSAHIGKASVENHQTRGQSILQPDVTKLYLGSCLDTNDVMCPEIFLKTANKKKPGTFPLTEHFSIATKIPKCLF